MGCRNQKEYIHTHAHNKYTQTAGYKENLETMTVGATRRGEQAIWLGKSQRLVDWKSDTKRS